MPRKARPTTPEPAAPPPAVPVVDAAAVYQLETFIRTFNLRKSTVHREWRLGRLRLAKRAGKIFVLGAWALEWLRTGEVKPPTRQPGGGGAA